MDAKVNELLPLLAKGNEKAYRSLYDLYYSRVCRWVQRYIHDSDEVCDVVQDIFISLWTNRVQYAGADNFDGYLSYATKHICINYIKKINRKKNLFDNQTVVNVGHDPVKSFINMDHINTAIDMLPTRMRQVLQMKLEGHNPEYICEQTGTAPSTIFNQIVTANKILHEKLFSRERKMVIPMRRKVIQVAPDIDFKIITKAPQVPDKFKLCYEYVMSMEVYEPHKDIYTKFNFRGKDVERFTKRYGVTVVKAITLVLLEKARVLLRTTDKSTEEIATLTGYSWGQSFCQAYRGYFGHSPINERNKRLKH